jgi:hypothetical protein
VTALATGSRPDSAARSGPHILNSRPENSQRRLLSPLPWISTSSQYPYRRGSSVKRTPLGARPGAGHPGACDGERLRLGSDTLASVPDIHALPIPPGTVNGEYGPPASAWTCAQYPRAHWARIERAKDISAHEPCGRWTRNLIALEAEDSYFSWVGWPTCRDQRWPWPFWSA